MEINRDEDGRVFIKPHASLSITSSEYEAHRNKALDAFAKTETELANLQFCQILDLVKFNISISGVAVAAIFTALARGVGDPLALMASGWLFLASIFSGSVFILKVINMLPAKFSDYKKRRMNENSVEDWVKIPPPSFYDYYSFLDIKKLSWYGAHHLFFRGALVAILVVFLILLQQKGKEPEVLSDVGEQKTQTEQTKANQQGFIKKASPVDQQGNALKGFPTKKNAKDCEYEKQQESGKEQEHD